MGSGVKVSSPLPPAAAEGAGEVEAEGEALGEAETLGEALPRALLPRPCLLQKRRVLPV